MKRVTFSGCQYCIGDFILENERLAAKIKKIYASEVNDTVVLCFELFAIINDINLSAYKVGELRGNGIDIILNFENQPSSIHNTGGNTYIKLRI